MYGEGSSDPGSPLCGCTGICVGTGWRTCVAEALRVNKKKGIKCSKGCSSKLFLPDLESLFDEIKMAFSASI